MHSFGFVQNLEYAIRPSPHVTEQSEVLLHSDQNGSVLLLFSDWLPLHLLSPILPLTHFRVRLSILVPSKLLIHLYQVDQNAFFYPHTSLYQSFRIHNC